MNWVVGLIFSLSVHQRKVLFGAGYPLPIRLVQKESSSFGVVRITLNGRFWREAASWMRFKTFSVYSIIRGFSTRVLLHTIYIYLFLLEYQVYLGENSKQLVTTWLNLSHRKSQLSKVFCCVHNIGRGFHFLNL